MVDARRAARLFVIAAVIEACTWAALLVGMYFKYVPETTDVLVSVFGALHGAAFVVYVAASLLAAWRLRWSVAVTLWALAASIPPFTTLVFEVVARRKGLLDPPPEGSASG